MPLYHVLITEKKSYVIEAETKTEAETKALDSDYETTSYNHNPDFEWDSSIARIFDTTVPRSRKLREE